MVGHPCPSIFQTCLSVSFHSFRFCSWCFLFPLFFLSFSLCRFVSSSSFSSYKLVTSTSVVELSERVVGEHIGEYCRYVHEGVCLQQTRVPRGSAIGRCSNRVKVDWHCNVVLVPFPLVKWYDWRSCALLRVALLVHWVSENTLPQL